MKLICRWNVLLDCSHDIQMIDQNALDLSWLGNKVLITRKITKMITENRKEKKKRLTGLDIKG